MSHPKAVGRGALVIPVPALEPIVSRWRDRLDQSAARRMPAHITVMYPFLSSSELTSEVRSRLAEVCERMRAIDVAFTSTGTFPGVVYLTPSPADEVRLLTQLVVRTWPDLLPYEGVHGDDIPHLTVAYADDPRLARRIADELEARLPISARLTVASIFVFDGTTWRERFSLPLGQ